MKSRIIYCLHLRNLFTVTILSINTIMRLPKWKVDDIWYFKLKILKDRDYKFMLLFSSISTQNNVPISNGNLPSALSWEIATTPKDIDPPLIFQASHLSTISSRSTIQITAAFEWHPPRSQGGAEKRGRLATFFHNRLPPPCSNRGEMKRFPDRFRKPPPLPELWEGRGSCIFWEISPLAIVRLK